MSLKKLFGLQSRTEKIKEYLQLKRELQNINFQASNLAEANEVNKSMRDSLIKNGETESAKTRFKAFIDDQILKVSNLSSRKRSVEKSLKKLSSDQDLSEAIEEIDQILEAKQMWKSGSIKKSVYDQILKARQGVVRYADVLVMRNGKLLILERAEEGNYTGKWCIPGGHVDPGEDFREAACRELFEETGIELIEESLSPVGSYKKNGVEIHYFMVWMDPEAPCQITVDADESLGYEWITPSSELKEYDFIFDMQDNLKRIFGIQEENLIQPILKALSDGEISFEEYSNFCQAHPDLVEKANNQHYFSHNERKDLASKGEAMPDGKYPIRNSQDLKDAIRLVGVSNTPKSEVKAWIKKRAKELNLETELPEGWVEKAVGVASASALQSESLDSELKSKKPVGEDKPDNDIEKAQKLTHTKISMEITDENEAKRWIKFLSKVSEISRTGEEWGIQLATEDRVQDFVWKKGLFKIVNFSVDQEGETITKSQEDSEGGFSLRIDFTDMDDAAIMKAFLSDVQQNGQLDIDNISEL